MRRCAVTLLAAAACVLSPAAAQAASGTRAVATSFLEALSRHDGRAACALMTSGEQRAVGRVLWGVVVDGPVPCHTAIAVLIHGIYENGPVFRRFARPRFRPERRVGGFVSEAADVDLVTDQFRQRALVVLWLGRVGGHWRVVQSASAIGALGNGSSDYDHLDPPADPRRMPTPFPLPRPRFTCAVHLRRADAAGDEHAQQLVAEKHVVATPAPWLDVRSVRAGTTPGGQPCLGIELGAPPRPSTLVDVSLDIPSRGGRTALIDLDGQGGSSGYNWDEDLEAGPGYGLTGTTLWLLLGRRDAWQRGTTLCVSTDQFLEPLLPHPLHARDCVEA